mgnify:CR=1 FL=1|tara:strand:+ start:147 stop:635 length:489 start_codon:yes stop_codon:yes gene_type:complete
MLTEKMKADRNYRVTNNNAIDVHVGRRVRLRRTLIGMSQEQLGVALNITFQQIQKYERGSNRISASRLWDISEALDIPVSYFFDDMPDDAKANSPRRVRATGESTFETPPKDHMARRETLELVRAYYAIKHKSSRQYVVRLLRSMSTSPALGEDQQHPVAAE